MMRKKVLLLMIISMGSWYTAQVGINQVNPNLSSDLELGSKNKTLLLNRVPTTGSVSNPTNGMMIYDVSEECVKAFQGGQWSKCLGKGLLKTSNSLSSTLSLSCASAVISPSPVAGQSYNGTLTIPYTGGNGSSYTAQSLEANGLSAVLPAGSFTKGSGNLQYSITGTLRRADKIPFNIDIAGIKCTIATIK